MIDMSTKVKVDISLNNHSSIEKTELICVSTCSNKCISCTLNSYITGIIFVKKKPVLNIKLFVNIEIEQEKMSIKTKINMKKIL